MPICLVIGETSISTCWRVKNALVFKAITRLTKYIPLHSHEIRTRLSQGCKGNEIQCKTQFIIFLQLIREKKKKPNPNHNRFQLSSASSSLL